MKTIFDLLLRFLAGGFAAAAIMILFSLALLGVVSVTTIYHDPRPSEVFMAPPEPVGEYRAMHEARP